MLNTQTFDPIIIKFRIFSNTMYCFNREYELLFIKNLAIKQGQQYSELIKMILTTFKIQCDKLIPNHCGFKIINSLVSGYLAILLKNNIVFSNSILCFFK